MTDKVHRQMMLDPDHSAVEERNEEAEKRWYLAAKVVEQFTATHALGQLWHLQLQHQQGHGNGKDAIRKDIHASIGKLDAADQFANRFGRRTNPPSEI